MKRLSFFLTLIVTAALGSVFVASAQDPQEAPPAAPAAADEGDEAPSDDAAPDAAPDDEAPTDEAPTDEAPADEGPADEAPADDPPMDGDEPMEPMDGGDEPMEPMDGGDEPMEPMDGGDEPMDSGDAAPTDAAPDEAPEAAPEAAPAPKKRKSSALSSLSVEEGQAQLERTAKQEGAEPRRATLEEGTQVGLTTRDTALLDAESSGIAKFGGCEVTLSENTTFKVLEVGDEVSLVEILGVELELERGTILEAAFGSLSLNLRAGRLTARNNSGVPQVVQIRVGNNLVTVTTPSGASFGADGGGSGAITVGAIPLTIVTQPVDASGNPTGPPVTTTISPGQNLSTALGVDRATGGQLADQIVTQSQDAPPAGTTPGTTPASAGISGS